MGEVKLTGKPMSERIADHLKSSCSPEADVHVQQGTGPTRVHHAVHLKGNVMQRGDDVRGQDIHGNARGPANTKGEI
jgi:hypothetical protein